MELIDLEESLKNLTSPRDAEIVSIYVGDLLNGAGDLSEIKEFLDYFSEKLSLEGSAIETANPTLYEKYQSFWILLAFKVFSVIESADQQNLLETRFLSAVKAGFDPEDIISEYFATYQSTALIRSSFKVYARYLEQNIEQFGSIPIEIDGHKLLPTLKYWISDYSKFPSKVARRGSIERLNYINQSINTRSLPQIQRQILLKILKFYDDLINPERPITKLRPSQPLKNLKAAYQSPDMDFKPPSIKLAAPLRLPEIPKLDIDKKLDELKTRAPK